MDVFDLFAKITLDSSEYEKALKRTKAESQAFVSGSYTKGFEKVAGTVMKIGTALAGVGTAAAGFAVKVGSGFESAMSQTQAIFGITDKMSDEYKKLEDTAREYGKTTQYSASESADALKYMALAGWDVEQATSALPGVLNLAAASSMDLAQASDMVTDYMSAFGIEADQSAYFADVLAYAQNNANTTVDQLGQAYQNCAANMNASGQDFETTTALLEAMANQGTKGSLAGTQLAAMMRDLTAKMKNGAITIGNTSIAVQDSNGNFRDMTDILTDVSAATDGMGDAQRATALSSVFTADSLKGVNLILNEGVDNIAKYEEELRNANGTAADAAKINNDNLAGALKELSSAAEEVGIAVYKKFQEPLTKAVDKVTEIVQNINIDDLIEKGKNMLDTLAKFAPAIAAIVSAATGLYGMIKIADKLKAFGEMAAAISKAGGLIASIGGPIAIVVAAIAALVAGFATLYATNENFRNGVNAAWDAISAKIQEVVAFVQPYVQAAMQVIGQVVTQVITDLTPVIQSIGEAFSAAWSLVQTVWAWASAFFQAIFQAIIVIFTPFAPIISGFFQGAWIIIQSIWNVAVSFFQTVFNLITGVFSTIDAVLSGDFQGAWESIQGIFEGVFDFFSTVGQNVVEGIKGGIAAVWDGLVSFVQGLWDGIKSIFVINAGDVKNNTGSDGSHAGGMDYVPYNNYVANLHRGEMVLTADEADSYRRGKGSSNGFNLTQNIYAAKQTPVELAASTAAYFQRARWAL